ncbi:MAG TPA: YdjY domain-containing protein [Tepidisphaeraceae bacterium]|nr:YdjY domain-containing protein [Tepidisphaeraceae bacterium]
MRIHSTRGLWCWAALCGVLAVLPAVGQADPPPATSPSASPDTVGQKLAHIKIDAAHKKVYVECEALAVDAPVEFFCCVKGTNDYESILRSDVRPSDLHFALLAIGLKPGAPLTYNESTNTWIPPRGAPLHIEVQYQKDGKTVAIPAYRLMRDVKNKKEPKAFAWVFCGSRILPDGKYAADVTGYLLSVCNFDLTVIDVPALVSSSNETLEWERDPTTTPKAGTTVWLVISAAQPGDKTDAQNRGPAPTTRGAPGGAPGGP